MKSSPARAQRRLAAKQPCTHAQGRARVVDAVSGDGTWRATVGFHCRCDAPFVFPISGEGEMPSPEALQEAVSVEWGKLTVTERNERRMRDNEALKVARCNTCGRWFETFAARNEHREEHRASLFGATPASEQTVEGERVG